MPLKLHAHLTRRSLLLAAALALAGCSSPPSNRAPKEIHVMTSGGFTAAAQVTTVLPNLRSPRVTW